MDKDSAVWRFYRHPGDERDLPTRPSHVILTACHQANLFRVINESLSLYCWPRGKVNAEKFLAIYARYLDWMQSLPPIVRDIDEGDQPLPHILYLQYVQSCNSPRSPCSHVIASNIILLWYSILALSCIPASLPGMIKKSYVASLFSMLEVALRYLSTHDASTPVALQCPC